jgi:predicted nucleotidyltransferase
MEKNNPVRAVELAKAFLIDEPKVKFAYLFGSHANGQAGPLSDIDLAVYLDGRLDLFKWRLRLMDALAGVLKSENFDLVVLNNAPILLSYEVISNGIVLKDDRQRRVMYESRTLRDYLDTAYLRDVQRRYLLEQIKRGDFFG